MTRKAASKSDDPGQSKCLVSGFIDPPGAFAGIDEWRAFEQEARALPRSPYVDAVIEEAVAGVKRAGSLPVHEDDFSELAEE